MDRTCRYCSQPLKQRSNEKKQEFAKREFCSIKCAARSRVERKPQKRPKNSQSISIMPKTLTPWHVI